MLFRSFPDYIHSSNPPCLGWWWWCSPGGKLRFSLQLFILLYYTILGFFYMYLFSLQGPQANHKDLLESHIWSINIFQLLVTGSVTSLAHRWDVANRKWSQTIMGLLQINKVVALFLTQYWCQHFLLSGMCCNSQLCLLLRVRWGWGERKQCTSQLCPSETKSSKDQVMRLEADKPHNGWDFTVIVKFSAQWDLKEDYVRPFLGQLRRAQWKPETG